MFALLLVAFVVVPLLELYVIVELSGAIGFLETLAAMIVISAIGAWLAKHQGFAVLARIRSQLDQGRVPGNELIDGALILAGGLLLLTPGFITDVFGIVLLFPLTRAPIRSVLRRVLRVRFVELVPLPRRNGGADRDDVIDV